MGFKLFQKIKSLLNNLADYFGPFFYRNKIKDIKNLAILLGPYRNLSTLTASVFSLHPNCQVLNHAGRRVFNKEIDFLKNYSEKRFNKFLMFAVYASIRGKRGNYGGGIFHSHAFDHDILKKKYYSRYKKHLKKNIRCIFWKESLRVSNHIKNININEILSKNKKLKFILPVRNPIDCAYSNLKTGHYKIFGNKIKNIDECLEEIFREFIFFLKLKEKYPLNFFYFFQDEFNKQLPEMASFLDIPKEEIWLNDSLEVIKMRSTYSYDKKIVSKYLELTNKYFKTHPEFKKHLVNLIKK